MLVKTTFFVVQVVAKGFKSQSLVNGQPLLPNLACRSNQHLSRLPSK